MSAIIVLVFIGIIVAAGFLAAFIWAVKSGQYDDDYSPSVRMLFDNKSQKVEQSNSRTVEQSNSRTVEKSKSRRRNCHT